MKNNLLDKAIRLILGIVSVLPQKRSGTAKSDTNTPATAGPSKELSQADKNLKPEAIKTVSSAEPRKASKTIPADASSLIYEAAHIWPSLSGGPRNQHSTSRATPEVLSKLAKLG